MNRRVLLQAIVKGFAVTGFGFLAWPFVKSWIPEFGQSVSREVDLSGLGAGEIKVVRWLGRNVLILKRNRSMLQQIERAQDLKDPMSTESVQPAAARNPGRSLLPDYFVAYANCTHLGCEVSATGTRVDGIAFRCPCHDSEYDYAGRIKRGSVAPLNLEVPNYSLVSGNLIRLKKVGQ